ncbi:ISL3 family transposase [Roseinatronobacter monicus]|uniref:Transposase n=1 Tax=Roseinatronobacter monicus TaxID=393481 RepID=A0A543KFU4_9RHOB|nr:ISL3 family transposase [Roseinatronobacter monicus]TQM93949.1 transposase [Roseinatronobacter monicus]
MGPETSLFTTALGLQAPWSVTDVRFDAKLKEIHFDVRFKAGSRFACPSCGAPDQPVHDTRSRIWEHLRFFEHKAFIHADVPRVACSQCSKTGQVPVPWARSGSGFSQLFEAFVIALVRQMPVKAVADMLDVGDDRLWRVLDHYVSSARDREDFSAVTALGIDETAARRGHNYITLFHDLLAGRLLFACEGRDAKTVAAFGEDLRAHGGDPDAISAACIDMSRAYISGVAKHLSNADVTFDPFHVIQLANVALEEVRRAEVRSRPELKHSRWMWLKDKKRWTKRQITQHHDLSRMHLKTGRAFRLKEALRDIFAEAESKAEAEERLTAWFQWARRSRLPAFKKLALTLKAHWDGILNGFDSDLSNGAVEAINGLIQAAKARARGYRKTRNLINMSYLIAGNLTHLPASPYRTTSCATGK